MKCRVFTSNAASILEEVMQRGLTQTQAAELAKLPPATLSRAMSTNQKIHLRTAARLRSAFGADCVTVTEPERA